MGNIWDTYTCATAIKKKRESSKVVLFWHLRTCKWLLNSFSGDSFTISCAVVVSLPSPSLSLFFYGLLYYFFPSRFSTLSFSPPKCQHSFRFWISNGPPSRNTHFNMPAGRSRSNTRALTQKLLLQFIYFFFPPCCVVSFKKLFGRSRAGYLKCVIFFFLLLLLFCFIWKCYFCFSTRDGERP